jgi:hypothetical protein
MKVKASRANHITETQFRRVRWADRELGEKQWWHDHRVPLLPPFFGSPGSSRRRRRGRRTRRAGKSPLQKQSEEAEEQVPGETEEEFLTREQVKKKQKEEMETEFVSEVKDFISMLK